MTLPRFPTLPFGRRSSCVVCQAGSPRRDPGGVALALSALTGIAAFLAYSRTVTSSCAARPATTPCSASSSSSRGSRPTGGDSTAGSCRSSAPLGDLVGSSPRRRTALALTTAPATVGFPAHPVSSHRDGESAPLRHGAVATHELPRFATFRALPEDRRLFGAPDMPLMMARAPASGDASSSW